MDRREVKSLIGAFLVACLLLSVAIWFLWRWDQSGGTPNDASPANEQKEPAPQVNAFPPEEMVVAVGLAVTEEIEGVATRIEGPDDAENQPISDTDLSAKTEPVTPETPVREEPPTEPSPADEDLAATPQDSSPKPEDMTREPVEVSLNEKDDMETAEESSSRPTLEGHMPQLRYLGERRKLRQKYPPLEMVWILDRDPSVSLDEPARVLIDVVLDRDGKLYWRNSRVKRHSPGFRFATMRYNLTNRVLVRDARKLRIWKRRNEIFAIAKVDSTALKRFKWGYYPHRAETHMQNQVKAAYRKAVQEGKIKFDPSEGDHVEINWKVDEKGEPYVGSAFFRSKSSPDVELSL